MALYFFNTADGRADIDDVGTELPSDNAARIHAIKYAGEILSHEPIVVWNGHEFTVEVTDESGACLFAVVVHAIEGPATGRTGMTR